MFKSKVYRLFCFLFAFSLVFALFGVEVNAASDNLISSDLTTWSDVSNLEDNVYPITVTPAGDIYRLTLSDQEYPIYFGAILDETSLIAGHSYSLSFKIPGRTEINTAFDKTYSASVFENHFKNSEVRIGVGYISSSGEVSFPEVNVLYHITKDNYTKYFGKSLRASFISSNYTGTPVILIHIASLDGADHTFYFSDFRLVDNDDNSAELTGIKGFLHSIRWDLVGGTCEEEDCPHSSGDNPHLSLSERMSSGFASMFQNIGDKFEEGSTLNIWFNGLSDKVGSINGSLSGLGDRINGFFSGLGDRISGFFSNLGDRMSGFFNNLGTSIGGFFSDLKTNMSNWFSELGNKITTKFQEIGDKFSEFFDKFKPRVSISLKWVPGTLNSNTGQLDSKNHNSASVSEFFDVVDATYYLEHRKSLGDFTSGFYYQYDLDHNYIGSTYIPPDAEPIILEPGYSYRFRLYRGADVSEIYGDNLSNACNEVLVVYAEEGWINALLYNMKMGIKGLFVPDEAFIATWKGDMDVMLEEHLGFLYQIPDFTISYVQVIRDTLKDNDTIEFTFPEIEFEFNGEKIHLWDAIKVDFSFLEKEPFSTIYSIYKVGIIIIFGAALFMYGKHVWKKVMSN